MQLREINRLHFVSVSLYVAKLIYSSVSLYVVTSYLPVSQAYIFISTSVLISISVLFFLFVGVCWLVGLKIVFALAWLLATRLPYVCVSVCVREQTSVMPDPVCCCICVWV